MAINFETALGVHPTALKARTERANLLANNLANAETPGYKARDMDFQKVFEQSQFNDVQGLNMNVTSAKHTPGGAEIVDNGDLLYRTPTQPSIDGNTVEEHVEHAQYMENAMAFEASFLFLKSKFSGMLSAIRGE